MKPVAFDKDYADRQLRRSRHPIRRAIKAFYIANILQDVIGPAIDFGCGAGQLLARLPPRSIGLELNPYLVTELSRKGLNVIHYDGQRDGFRLEELPTGTYKTLVLAHVLEHFDEVPIIFATLLASSARLGIVRVIVVVPGAKGFASDVTHRTFVNHPFMKEHGLCSVAGYRLANHGYFPINYQAIGDYFAYHELKLIYDRIA